MRAARSVGAASALVILLFVVPWVLVKWGAWRGLAAVAEDPSLLLAPDEGALVMIVLTLLGTVFWVVMAVSVGLEIVDLKRGRAGRSIRPGLLRWPRHLIRPLVAAVFALTVVGGSLAPAIAVPGADLVASQAAESRPEARADQTVRQADSPPDVRVDQGVRLAIPAGPGTYVVAPGDSLWSIAEAVYGDGTQWTRIAEANADLVEGTGDLIQVGWQLRIPAIPTPEAPRPGTYVVAPGDSLWSIAEHLTGNGNRWVDLAAANPALQNPAVIQPGQVLVVPFESPAHQVRPQIPDTPLAAGHPTDPPAESADSAEPANPAVPPASANPAVPPASADPAAAEVPPSASPSSAEVPASSGTSPAAAADNPSAPADATADSDGSGLVTMVIGASAMLAGGLTLLLQRRRQVQLRLRPLGRRIVGPGGDGRQLETALAMAGATRRPGPARALVVPATKRQAAGDVNRTAAGVERLGETGASEAASGGRLGETAGAERLGERGAGAGRRGESAVGRERVGEISTGRERLGGTVVGWQRLDEIPGREGSGTSGASAQPAWIPELPLGDPGVRPWPAGAPTSGDDDETVDSRGCVARSRSGCDPGQAGEGGRLDVSRLNRNAARTQPGREMAAHGVESTVEGAEDPESASVPGDDLDTNPADQAASAPGGSPGDNQGLWPLAVVTGGDADEEVSPPGTAAAPMADPGQRPQAPGAPGSGDWSPQLMNSGPTREVTRQSASQLARPAGGTAGGDRSPRWMNVTPSPETGTPASRLETLVLGRDGEGEADASGPRVPAKGLAICVGEDAQAEPVFAVVSGGFGVTAPHVELASAAVQGLLLNIAVEEDLLDVELHVVTTHDHFDTFEGVTRHDTSEDALKSLRSALLDRRSYLGSAEWDELRQDPNLGEAWRPVIYFFAEPVDEPSWQAISEALAGPETGVAAVACLASSSLPGHHLRVETDDRAILSPDGVTLRPFLMRPSAPLNDLLVQTASTDTGPAWWYPGAPTEDQPYEATLVWRSPAVAATESGDSEPAACATVTQLDEALTAVTFSHPVLRLLGPITLEGACGTPPGKGERSCMEYCAWLLGHPGATATAMSQGLLVAEGTRRSTLSRLRTWLGHDANGLAYLPEAYTGRIWLSAAVTSDWHRLCLLAAGGVEAASTDNLLTGLQLVRGIPLADAAPGQWGWAEELRTDMVSLVRDIGVVVTRRCVDSREIDKARWAASRALAAAPEDELLLGARVLTEYAAGNRLEVERLVAWITRNVRGLGIDLLPETVQTLRQVSGALGKR
ncbi:MAG: LysM peptidoglycan-binding domain-containing protein [Propionibacteriaceae bacterium]|jgi:LysM repeat protein|nr:LysM peptidoglycan-binding domain-containing protein [Propionibacteriaceae bacterium]